MPGFKISITPINPTIKVKKILELILSLRIGAANKAINRGDVAFNSVASDKPMFVIAKYKHVIAEILIRLRKTCR